MTALEFARQLGEPLEHIREWQALGLVGRDDADEFRGEDVPRARLVQFLVRRGLGPDVIARADRDEAVLTRYVEMALGDRSDRTHSLAEAAERFGLAADPLARLCEAAGLAEQGDLLTESDLEMLGGIKVGLDAGLPEDAMLQLLRVYADALGRVAEAESRLFHLYVHEPLKVRGLSGPEQVEAVRAAADRVTPLIEPAVLYFHRKGREKAIREDAVLHVREHAGLWKEPEVPGQVRVTIAFVDLAGFTSLAEAMGDQMAAQVLERFSQLVREAVSRFDGRVVKQIGDAFMLVFPEPRPAIECTMQIERSTAAEPQFPAVRTGIHSGPALYREGDYLGTTVNIAARLAAEAERHQILVTAAARRGAESLPDGEFVPLGKRRLRGLMEEFELFGAVARVDAGVARRMIDPVCGMELVAAEAAARLTFDGLERVFCSQRCLQLFVVAPERY